MSDENDSKEKLEYNNIFEVMTDDPEESLRMKQESDHKWQEREEYPKLLAHILIFIEGIEEDGSVRCRMEDKFDTSRPDEIATIFRNVFRKEDEQYLEEGYLFDWRVWQDLEKDEEGRSEMIHHYIPPITEEEWEECQRQGKELAEFFRKNVK